MVVFRLLDQVLNRMPELGTVYLYISACPHCHARRLAPTSAAAGDRLPSRGEPRSQSSTRLSAAAALGIGEPQSLRTELRFENTILFLKVSDHLLLVPLDPTSDHRDQDMEHHSRSSGGKP